MRVLVLVHAFPPVHCAGAEMTAFALLRHLAARGHRVDVSLTVQDGEPYTIEGLHVYPYEGPGDPLTWFGDPARRPDLVITYLDSTVRSAILCRMHGIPLCHLIHNTFDFSLEMVARGPSDLVTYHADWVREEYEAFLTEYAIGGIPPCSIMVHPPVEPRDYAVTPGRSVTLINLWENKGVKLFWKLAEAMPDVPFLGVKGGYGEQELHELPNVTICEHVPHSDMAAVVYARTKILLMPSKYESYGRTAVEAACSGIPTIAHPTPGLREALGDAGTFVDRHDLEGWVAAIRYLRSSRGYNIASHHARKVAARQDPIADMNRWCDLAEEVDAMALSTLAQITDVEARIGHAVVDEERVQVQAMLEDASAVVRNYTRRDFTQAQSTDLFRAVGEAVRLTNRPVVSVESIAVLGAGGIRTPLPTWFWDGADKVFISAGPADYVINLPASLYELAGDSHLVEVTYTHGYAEIPADIVAVVAGMVVRAQTLPGRGYLAAETVGDDSYRIAGDRQPASGPLALRAEDREVLNAYRSGGRRTVELRG